MQTYIICMQTYYPIKRKKEKKKKSKDDMKLAWKWAWIIYIPFVFWKPISSHVFVIGLKMDDGVMVGFCRSQIFAKLIYMDF